MKSILLPATIHNIIPITEFVNDILEANDCAMKAQIQLEVAIDEIVSNIANYAYGVNSGDVKVEVEMLGDFVRLTFIDSGKPFNPLEMKEPDVTETAMDDSVGGLGIFIVKKTMDEMSYRYENQQNILTIKKRIH